MKKVQFLCKVLGPDGGDTMTTRHVSDVKAVKWAKAGMCIICDAAKGPGYKIDPDDIDITTAAAKAEHAKYIAEINPKPAKAAEAGEADGDTGDESNGEGSPGVDLVSMTKKELAAFAKEKGFNVDATQKKDDLIASITAAMEAGEADGE